MSVVRDIIRRVCWPRREAAAATSTWQGLLWFWSSTAVLVAVFTLVMDDRSSWDWLRGALAYWVAASTSVNALALFRSVRSRAGR